MSELIPERQELPPENEAPGSAVDPPRPNVARLYDYLLGGKEGTAADRALGDQIIAALPQVQAGVQAQRAVLGRVVRYLVGEAGVDQLLDIRATPGPAAAGTGPGQVPHLCRGERSLRQLGPG